MDEGGKRICDDRVPRLVGRVKAFAAGENRLSGKRYRIMNEVPTLLMLIIVFSVVVKF